MTEITSNTAAKRAARQRLWLQRAAIGLAALALIAGLSWGLRKLNGESAAPKRQMARIAILPDTPPPPPPPPPKERKEEPKAEQRPQNQPDTPKPQTPDNAPIKMEGAAGNGPSAFQSGAVTQDYRGGAPTVGGSASGAAGVGDRAAQRLYAGTVRQMLRDEIERQLPQDTGEVQAKLSVWVAADGRISRWEFEPLAEERGNKVERLDDAMRRSQAALQLPTPPNMPQPLRFSLQLRVGG